MHRNRVDVAVRTRRQRRTIRDTQPVTTLRSHRAARREAAPTTAGPGPDDYLWAGVPMG